MITRRQFGAMVMALWSGPSSVSAQTATPDTQVPGVITFQNQSRLWDQVVLDHYRVVDLSAWIPGESCVIGALVNTSDDPVDVPFGINIVLRDVDSIIIGTTLLIPDYPILPPSTLIGFRSLAVDIPFAEIDSTKVDLDIKAAHWMESGVVDRLASHSIEVVSAQDVSTGDGNLQVEITLTNTSTKDFDNGFDPRVSVWDNEGRYCGSAFANMFSRLPAGETIRFTTQTNGSIPNPLDLSGDGYTWDVWITPR